MTNTKNNLPKGWEVRKLGDVCSMDKVKHDGTGLPFVGMEDIVSGENVFTGSLEPANVKSSTFAFSGKHILYGRLRPYLNKVLLPDFSGHCSTEIFPLLPNQEIHRKYIYYWLNLDSTLNTINKTCTGTRMPRANVNEMLTFQIPVPPLPEQERIVSVLDGVFANIDNAINNTQQSLDNTNKLFQSGFKNILGQNSFDMKAMKDVCDVRDGTHDSPKYQDSGRMLITSKNLKNGEIVTDNVKYISEDDYLAINKRSFVEKGDILFAMIGTIGNPVIVNYTPDFSIKNVALFKCGAEINNCFLLYILSSKDIMDKMLSEAKGTTQKFVGLGYLRQFKIPVPPIEEQKRIVQELDILSEKTKKLQTLYTQKLTHLKTLKKSTLQKAFRGEL